jgi:carbonic anhydrase/acetyltransferase-like protein (isoleucine patch superfamily)
MFSASPHPAPPLLFIGGGGHALTLAESARAGSRPLAGFYDDNHAAALAFKARVRHLGTIADALAALTHAHQSWVTRGGSPRAPDAQHPHPLQQLGYAPLAIHAAPGHQFLLALGDLAIRAAFLARAADAGVPLDSPVWGVLVHPSASVASSARVDPGVSVGPLSIIQAHARVRAHAIINSGVIVEHDCDIAPNCHIAPGVVLGGTIRVGDAEGPACAAMQSAPQPPVLVGLGSRVLPNLSIGAGAIVGAGSVVIGDVARGETVVGVPAVPVVR